MNSCELTALVTALANAIYADFSPEEVAVISAVLMQLGDTLATKLAFKALGE